MTLTQLLSECYRRMRYTSSPPAALTTRLTAYLNETHRQLCSIEGLERLRQDVLPVTATANVARTGLPPSVVRIGGITDRTNNIQLRQVPLKELRITDPAQAFTGGYPTRYSVIGNQAVQRQPASAGGLWAVSSSAGDTTQKVFVETILTGGYQNNIITAGTTLTGTVRVAIGAVTSYLLVTRFYLDTAGAGFVSLYDAPAAGNLLATIPVGKTWSRYLAIEWWPIPTADITDYADITHDIYDLVSGTDEPIIPVDFHELLTIGAIFREYATIDDNRSLLFKAEFDQGVKRLEGWVMDDPDRIASLRPIPNSWNRFGGTYPAEHFGSFHG